MSRRGLERLLAGAIAVALLVVLWLARQQGAAVARETARRAALADSVAVLLAQLAREADTLKALARENAAAAAQLATARRAADRATAQFRTVSAQARAAAASDTTDLAEARRLLVVLADRGDSLIARHAAERASASTRIARLEQTVHLTVVSRSTALALAEVQGRRAEAALRRRPWYQRAAGALCAAGLTGSGAGAGAAVGGPVGAAVGGISGLVAGRVACP